MRKAIPFLVKSLVESWQICFQDPQFKIAITQQQGADSFSKRGNMGWSPGKRAVMIVAVQASVDLGANVVCEPH